MENKVKVSLIIVIVFLVGFFTGTGVVATFLYINRPPLPFDRPPEDSPPPGPPGMILEKMTRALDLTPDQQEKVQNILDRTRDKMMVLREKNRPAFKRIFQQSQKEIAAVLNPGQKDKFDRLRKRLKQQFEKRGERRRPPRPGPKNRGGFGPPPAGP